jgi:hypothetical protein
VVSEEEEVVPEAERGVTGRGGRDKGKFVLTAGAASGFAVGAVGERWLSCVASDDGGGPWFPPFLIDNTVRAGNTIRASHTLLDSHALKPAIFTRTAVPSQTVTYPARDETGLWNSNTPNSRIHEASLTSFFIMNWLSQHVAHLGDWDKR